MIIKLIMKTYFKNKRDRIGSLITLIGMLCLSILVIYNMITGNDVKLTYSMLSIALLIVGCLIIE